jgi:hypothetical protein
MWVPLVRTNSDQWDSLQIKDGIWTPVIVEDP